MMAQLGLGRALDATWIDEMFEKESQAQYTRELLFSTTVEAMSLVALGLRPSVHAAAQSVELPVSIQALYGKLRNTETEVVREGAFRTGNCCTMRECFASRSSCHPTCMRSSDQKEKHRTDLSLFG